MSNPNDTLQILIDVRSRLDDVVKAQSEFRKMREEVTSTGQALKTGFGIEIARRGLDLLTGTLKQAVFESFRFAGQLKDTSEALGISADAYQVLTLEFKAAGADSGRLTMAISSQTQSLAAARVASSDAAQAYRDLGLSAASIELLPVEERLIAVAQATITAKDQTLAFDAAGKILGTRGLPQLLNALKRLGAEGLPALKKLLESQGQMMDNDTMERLDRASKQWEKLWHAIVIGSGNAIGVLDKFRVSAGKDFWGTVLDTLKGGGIGMSPDLLARMAMDNPAGPAKPKPNPKDIIEAQVRAAARTAEIEAVKIAEKAKADAVEAAAKRLVAVQEWREGIARDHAAELKREGEAIRESVMTPMEKYGVAVARVNQLYVQSVIDFDAFQRALVAANEDLEKATPKPAEKTPVDHYRRPEGVSEGALSFVANLGTTGQQVAGALESSLGATVNGITDGIMGWVTGAQDFGSSMLQIGSRVFGTMLENIIQLGVQWLVTQALIKTGMITTEGLANVLRSGRVVKENAAEAATLPAKTAGAAAAGISSFGAALLFGILAVALIASLSSGFSSGGYTGDMGRGDVAGVVHGQEFVLNAATTARLGPGFLERVNAGAPVSAAGAPAAFGGTATPPASGAGRESARNIHVYLDRSAWLDAVQNDLTGIAHAVYAKRARA